MRTGREGVNYLHGLGHRQIAFLSSRRRAHAITARSAGYQKRMVELKLKPRIVYSPDPATWGRPVPTALFCHNDWLAIQAILALRRRGLSVPGQVSVLGVDGSPTLAALHPGLSTLAYPIEELTAAILSRLEDKPASLSRAPFRIVAGQTAIPLAKS